MACVIGTGHVPRYQYFGTNGPVVPPKLAASDRITNPKTHNRKRIKSCYVLRKGGLEAVMIGSRVALLAAAALGLAAASSPSAHAGAGVTYTLSRQAEFGFGVLSPDGVLTYTAAAAARPDTPMRDGVQITATDSAGQSTTFLVEYEIYPAETPVGEPAAAEQPSAATVTVDVEPPPAAPARSGPSAIRLAPTTAGGSVRMCGARARLACPWALDRRLLFRIKLVGASQQVPVQLTLFSASAGTRPLYRRQLTVGAEASAVALQGLRVRRGLYTLKVTIAGRPLSSNVVHLLAR